MANIPGASGAAPGVYTDVQTLTRGVSIPGGTRLAAIMGEGSRTEVIVSSALGGGLDGLDSTFTTTAGADGRHFKLSLAPIIANRTTLYRNGLPLVGLEEAPDDNAFDNQYDYRIDTETGEFELQAAYLVDQGGLYYKAASTNYGTGSLENIEVVDPNAPTETWTIKCTSVQRDGYGAPMTETAKFIAFGTVSGAVLDGYGNPVIWKSDDVVVSNGIIKFSVQQNAALGSNNFKEGDAFTVKVKSGVLLKNDTLTASYIAETDLNDPTFFTSMEDIAARHGAPSTDNNLSLGCQLAFANSPPGVVCLQTKPALPRRTSYDLDTTLETGSDEDFIFPLPVGVTVDTNSSINFFTTNATTGVEEQIVPNKYTFYTVSDSSTSPTLTDFINSSSTYAYSYTVISRDRVTKSGSNGVIVASLTPGEGTLSSAGLTFSAADVGLKVKIFDASNPDNNVTATIASVVDGVLHLTHPTANFTDESGVTFQVIDETKTSSFVVLNKSVVTAGNSLRCTLVDARDASFYDAGWAEALAALETVDVDIVVPLPKQTISAIFQNTLAHCRTMSNVKNKRERLMFTGAIKGLDYTHVTGEKDAAVEDIGVLEGIQGDSVSEVLAGNTEDLANYSVSAAYGNTYRCVYFYPDEIVVQVGADRLALDGFYMAAAAAGYLSGIPNVAVPLTNKVLAGFTLLKTKRFSPTVIEKLLAAGITVVQPVAGGGTVIQGKTTTQSGFPEEEEISIIFIRDRIAKNLRQGFAGFVGLPEDPTLLASLTARAIGLLSSFISQGLITAYDSLQVGRDGVDPRQWNVKVKVQPVYPVNWIYVKVSVGLI